VNHIRLSIWDDDAIYSELFLMVAIHTVDEMKGSVGNGDIVTCQYQPKYRIYSSGA